MIFTARTKDTFYYHSEITQAVQMQRQGYDGLIRKESCHRLHQRAGRPPVRGPLLARLARRQEAREKRVRPHEGGVRGEAEGVDCADEEGDRGNKGEDEGKIELWRYPITDTSMVFIQTDSFGIVYTIEFHGF